MSEQASHSLSGNEWADRLLELESAKKDALVAFDPDSYDAIARDQMRLVSGRVPDFASISRDRALALAASTRLNSALLLNLISVSPHFALAREGYTADGEPEGRRRGRLRARG